MWCVFYLSPDSAYSPGAPQSSTFMYLTRLPVGGVQWTQRSPRATPGSAYSKIVFSLSISWALFIFNRHSFIIWLSQLMCSIVLG